VVWFWSIWLIYSVRHANDGWCSNRHWTESVAADDNNTFRSIYTYIYNLQRKKKKRKYTSKRHPRSTLSQQQQPRKNPLTRVPHEKNISVPKISTPCKTIPRRGNATERQTGRQADGRTRRLMRPVRRSVAWWVAICQLFASTRVSFYIHLYSPWKAATDNTKQKKSLTNYS